MWNLPHIQMLSLSCMLKVYFFSRWRAINPEAPDLGRWALSLWGLGWCNCPPIPRPASPPFFLLRHFPLALSCFPFLFAFFSIWSPLLIHHPLLFLVSLFHSIPYPFSLFFLPLSHFFIKMQPFCWCLSDFSLFGCNLRGLAVSM